MDLRTVRHGDGDRARCLPEGQPQLYVNHRWSLRAGTLEYSARLRWWGSKSSLL